VDFKMRQKGFAGVTVLILLVLAAVGYFGYQYFQTGSFPFSYLVGINGAPPTTIEPVELWKTYANVNYGYKILFPSTWILVDSAGSGPIDIYEPNSDGEKSKYFIEISVKSEDPSTELGFKHVENVLAGLNVVKYEKNSIYPVTNVIYVVTMPSGSFAELSAQFIKNDAAQRQLFEQVLSTFKPS
jgi:hypothetical protein